jgi:DNA-binding transcriptional ArsR family regulator
MQKILKALSAAPRKEILTLLKKGELTAGEIASNFNLTDATISHHLSVLKDAGLISDNKRGTFIYYEINTSVMEDLIIWLNSFVKKGEDNEEK